jgi:hypothetical protein
MRLSIEKMPFGTTLDSYADHTVQRIKRNAWTDISVEKNDTLLPDGNPAIKLFITASDGSYGSMQLLSLYGNLAYVIQYEAPIEYYDLYIGVANVALESVSITPPQSRAQVLLVPMIVAIAVPAAVVAIKMRNKNSHTARFFKEVKRLFPAALSIETLCVASAEIGGLLGLYYFGFSPFGITMAYLMAYALAGFTTFASILGRSHGK